MNEPLASRPLIVVALGATAREDYSIELVCQLAEAEAPELLGLFVEDADLLDHARSHWAREILLTGQERALDRNSLERQLRSLAVRVRARFEAATARLGLRHRFEVARGNVLAEPLRRAAAARALVLSTAQMLAHGGFTRQLLEARLPLVLLAREGWSSGQSVAVIVDAIGDSDPAIEVAARIARQSRSPVTVLLTVTDEARRGELLGQVEEALSQRGVTQRNIILLGGTGAGGIVLAARACRARLLVMPAPSEPEDTALIEALMRRFQGALMLVRSPP